MSQGAARVPNMNRIRYHLSLNLTILAVFTLQPLWAQDEVMPVEVDKSIDVEQEKQRQKEYAEGTKLFQAKKYAEALKHYSKAADNKCDDGECRIMVGYCYFHMNQYDKALKQYRLAAENGKRISVKNKAQKLAQRLATMMSGICPGNCLKPSMKGWRKMKVEGTPDRLVWMVYPYLDAAGKGGSEYWSNDHMGEVIEYVNGRPVNKGKCPICNGTGKITLTK